MIYQGLRRVICFFHFVLALRRRKIRFPLSATQDFLSKMKLTENQIEKLYQERLKIEAFCEPPIKTTAEIERENWQAIARKRKAEIDEILTNHFFPKPKEEGTERKESNGFCVMLKTAVKREIDVPAVSTIMKKLPPGFEQDLIDYKPRLKLKEFRNISEANRRIFSHCLIETPEKAVFEIVKQES